jgi:hypothetical protein
LEERFPKIYIEKTISELNYFVNLLKPKTMMTLAKIIIDIISSIG